MRYVTIGGLTVDNVISASGNQVAGQFGGNAAYSSAGIRIWAPGQVGMVARVGNNYPISWLKSAERAGIDLTGVRHLPIPHTLNSGMQYDRSGARQEKVSATEFDKLGLACEFPATNPQTAHQAQLDFGPEYTDIPLEYHNAQAILLAPRYYEKQLGCVKHLRGYGNKLMILDTGDWYMYPEREADLRELLGGIDAVLPSEVEVRSLFGTMDLVEAAKRLGDFGPPIVVIKVGKQGCIVYQRDRNITTNIPVFPLSATDPTGAGDSFCGGFLVGMHETGNPIEAACYGTVTASFIIEGFGAAYSYHVTREEAESRLAALKNII